MKLLIELDEEYVKVIDKIKFLVGGRTDRKLQLEIKAIKNGKPLDRASTTKNNLGIDCIDRAQVQTEIEMNAYRYTLAKERGGAGEVEWSSHLIDINDAVDIIRNLPSVTPQEPKTGHWIRISPAEIYECSECGQNIMTSDICAYKFCHGCGAKMIESKESEKV